MDANALLARMTECGIALNENAADRLCRYHELLCDWNTRMDLTNVTDEADMLDRHYVDSLSVLTIPGLIPAEGKLADNSITRPIPLSSSTSRKKVRSKGAPASRR